MKQTLLFSLALLVLSFGVEADVKTGAHLYSDNGSIGFPPDIVNLGEEIMEVGSVFVPKGFDANDQVEVVAYGFRPSPCYRTPYGSVERIGNDIKITVKAARITGRDRICIDMAVPYLIAIPVGPVPAGDYNVMVNQETGSPQFSRMEIDPPTNNSVDDFLYAQVENISIDAASRMVTLRGENPSPCIVLDRIISTSNGVNTYAVMPIMKQIDTLCPQVLTPFEYKYQLPRDLNSSKILVHVRTIEGDSKNTLFSPKN